MAFKMINGDEGEVVFVSELFGICDSLFKRGSKTWADCDTDCIKLLVVGSYDCTLNYFR